MTSGTQDMGAPCHVLAEPAAPHGSPRIIRTLGPGEMVLIGGNPEYSLLTNPPPFPAAATGTAVTMALTPAPAAGLSGTHLLVWYSDVGLRVRNVGSPSVQWQGWGQAVRESFVSRHPDGELVEDPLVTMWVGRDPFWRIGLVNPAGRWPARPTSGLWRTRPYELGIDLEASQLEAVLRVFGEFLNFPAQRDPRVGKSNDQPHLFNVMRKRLERLWLRAEREGLWQPPQPNSPTTVDEVLLHYLLRTASISYADVAHAVHRGAFRHITLGQPIPLWSPSAVRPGRP